MSDKKWNPELVAVEQKDNSNKEKMVHISNGRKDPEGNPIKISAIPPKGHAFAVDPDTKLIKTFTKPAISEKGLEAIKN